MEEGAGRNHGCEESAKKRGGAREGNAAPLLYTLDTRCAASYFARDGSAGVLADAKVANKRVVWNQAVDVKGEDRALTLDARNAVAVD
jgi:hypothetical protein